MDPTHDEARWLELYATLLGRLCHPLADRQAILWHAGLDEAAFTRLEAGCLRLLVAAIPGRAPPALAIFVKALAGQRGTPTPDIDLEEMMRTVPTTLAAARPADTEMSTLPSQPDILSRKP